MKQIRYLEVVRDTMDGKEHIMSGDPDTEVIGRFTVEAYTAAQDFCKGRGNDSGTKDARLEERDYTLFENLQEVEDQRRQFIRDNALNKLTDEEREVLGI